MTTFVASFLGGYSGVYEGAFDAASTAVARGIMQVGDETWLFGWGSQYTHGGYVGMSLPPCRGWTQPCPIKSGLQKLVLRKNGFVSLSTARGGEGAAAAVGSLATVPFKLPECSSRRGETTGATALTLHLNIFAAIGRGALIELRSPPPAGATAPDAASSNLLAQSELIEGGGTDYVVNWLQVPPNNTHTNLTREWQNGGCAYEAKARNGSLPEGSCDHGNYHHNCSSTKDCDCYVAPDGHVVHCSKVPGTCQGVHVECLDGICQSPNVVGGQSCGQWKDIDLHPPPVRVGSDLSKLGLGPNAEVVLTIQMWATDLYSVQFVCE
jgi:hypothetical protein